MLRYPKGESEIGMEGDMFPVKKFSLSLSRSQDKVGKKGEAHLFLQRQSPWVKQSCVEQGQDALKFMGPAAARVCNYSDNLENEGK